ncbi:DUF72 domain-containing protein [Mesorhizobium sophorae]|uniref:DUF72 domain-containing protein n=1 Tax=Mesorhizobium sophorae TaxID=1300294 RepID=UPI001FD95FFC|nr:DUF72 domain-containing protein [Mesorhizobium sophorae]
MKLLVRLFSPDTPGDAARVAFGIRVVLQASFDLPVELIELRFGFLNAASAHAFRAAWRFRELVASSHRHRHQTLYLDPYPDGSDPPLRHFGQLPRSHPAVPRVKGGKGNFMGSEAIKRKALGPEERRELRRLRREKQRIENVGRADKMHTARLAGAIGERDTVSCLQASAYVGCSGWFYWKWRGQFYPTDLPTSQWFNYYAKRFDTVEINASFYSWPTVTNVKSWLRQPGKSSFVYTVKVCELITHIKRFQGTKTLVKDFGMMADILGERMGCFLFQLPPSYHFTKSRLNGILSQLDPARRNVVEFRHASWWNETVYSAFRNTGTIFCSCSGPRLPDVLVRTAEDVYVRLHGPERWYRHDYTRDELSGWADKIRASGARRAWVYFNNDYEGFAPRNALAMRRLLEEQTLR